MSTQLTGRDQDMHGSKSKVYIEGVWRLNFLQFSERDSQKHDVRPVPRFGEATSVI